MLRPETARVSYSPKRPPLDPCPVEEVVGLIGGKWKARLLLLLTKGPQRLSALIAALPSVAKQVVIAQLAAMHTDGLVTIDFVRRGAVTSRLYRLSDEGWSLLPVLEQVAAWGEDRLARPRRPVGSVPVPAKHGALDNSRDGDQMIHE